MEVDRVCPRHGETKFVLASPNTPSQRYRCKQCRTEAVQRRRKNLKLMAIEYKGGKCTKCGYNKCIAALDFHHLDPEQKEFGLSVKGLTRSWDKTKKELDKCELVCANCHRELHSVNENVLETIHINVTCIVCNKEFSAIRSDNTICSEDCKNIRKRSYTRNKTTIGTN